MFKKWITYFSLAVLLALGRFTYPLVYQLFLNENFNTKNVQSSVIAHRGASGYAPENTLAAIQKALAQQADIIEFDVHLSQDGKLIIIHDNDLDRTTNLSGAVSDFTLAELKQADAGSWFNSTFKNEKLPTLSEVLQLINGRSQCIIELKGDEEGYYPQLAAKVAQEVADIKGETWCIIQSYESRYLDELHNINPHLKLVKAFIGLWPSPVLSFYYDTGFRWGRYQVPEYLWGVNLYYKTITKAQVAAWQNEGIKVWTYTINDESAMKKQLRMGIDGLITNYPDRLQNLLQ
jgi:glycerophosphoryl diester phosphodiesterase